MTEERNANITIAMTPAGLAVTVEYTGSLSSIPAAIERLKGAGIIDLVISSKPSAPQKITKSPRVAPAYSANGDPICPKHGKPLREGNYGLYCPSKDDTTERGYCAIKFAAI
jgi:hypothetical protein